MFISMFILLNDGILYNRENEESVYINMDKFEI